FGKKAVSGMDGVRARLLRRGDDVLDHQVALPRGGRPHADRLVAGADVQRAAVGVAVDGDGADSHLAAGAGDAHRDLAAVGDEDPGDRHGAGSYQKPERVPIVSNLLLDGGSTCGTNLFSSP